MIRIVGVGSPRGDDAAAWAVIERLRERLGQVPGIELVALDRPGVGILEWLVGAERVILIDAMRGGGPPGTFLRFSSAQFIDQAGRDVSSHGFGLAHALQLARTLGQEGPEPEIYGIELERLEGERLSPRVAAAVGSLAAYLVEEVCSTIESPLT